MTPRQPAIQDGEGFAAIPVAVEFVRYVGNGGFCLAWGCGLFGIIRPCRHQLGSELADAWRAHLCGMCLSLRDDHGQLARLATNYDGLIISVLAEAQATPPDQAGLPGLAGPLGGRRTAGPCPLRGMRRADVATGDCARLAATVSLILAAATVSDHAADRDGITGRPGIRTAARGLARHWASRAADAGAALGLDTAILTEAVESQAAVEAAAGLGTSLLSVTAPTETAAGAAFGHTAILAGRPENAEALTEAGRLFGRIAHILDAVEDLAADTATRAWNPLTATGTSLDQAYQICDDALPGIRLSLAGTNFLGSTAFTGSTVPVGARLAEALLVSELSRSVRHIFAAATGNGTGPTADDKGKRASRRHKFAEWATANKRRECCSECCIECCGECLCPLNWC